MKYSSKRPTKVVTVPEQLFHLGRFERGYDDTQWIEPIQMGKRPCRYLLEGDYVTVDEYNVTCPLCLKSKAMSKQRKTPKPVRSYATAEGRLFWKSIEKSAREYEATTTPEERLRNTMVLHPDRYKRVIRVGREYYPNGPWKVDLT